MPKLNNWNSSLPLPSLSFDYNWNLSEEDYYNLNLLNQSSDQDSWSNSSEDDWMYEKVAAEEEEYPSFEEVADLSTIQNQNQAEKERRAAEAEAKAKAEEERKAAAKAEAARIQAEKEKKKQKVAKVENKSDPSNDPNEVAKKFIKEERKRLNDLLKQN